MRRWPTIQNPMLDAYLEALPKGREPRILASRTMFVADDRKEALPLRRDRPAAPGRQARRDGRPGAGRLGATI